MGLPAIPNNSTIPKGTTIKVAPSSSMPAKQLPFSPLIPEIDKFKPVNIFGNQLRIPTKNCIFEKTFNLPLINSFEFQKSMILQKAISRKDFNGKPLYTKEDLAMLENNLNENMYKKIIEYNLFDLKNTKGDYKYNTTQILGILCLKDPIFDILKERILSPAQIDILEAIKLNGFTITPDEKFSELRTKSNQENIEKIKKELKEDLNKMLNIIKNDLINLKRKDGKYVFTSRFFDFFLFYASLNLLDIPFKKDLSADIIERITDDKEFNFENNIYIYNKSEDKTRSYYENMKKRNVFLEKKADGEYKYSSKQIRNVAELSDEDYLKFLYFEKCDLNGDFWENPIEPYIAVELAKLTPQSIDFLIENKIFDAFKEHKISEETFRDICFTLNKGDKLSETVLKDINLLKEGKTSSVIEFDESCPKKEVLEKTTQGDVIKIGEQLYINNKNSLMKYNISKEQFDRLFPIIDRFSTSQGESDNCYFIAALIAMMNNPITCPYIFSSFEKYQDGILCTIKGYKDFFGTTFFKEGKVQTADNSLYGTDGMKMFEQAYALTALRENDNNLKKSLYQLLKRIEVGNAADVLSEALGLDYTKVLSEKEFKKLNFFQNKRLKHSALVVNFNNKKNLEQYLSKYGNDKNVINIISWSEVEDLPKTKNSDMYTNHCYVIHSYNPEKKTVNIISPWEGVRVFELPLESVKKVDFAIANIEPKN